MSEHRGSEIGNRESGVGGLGARHLAGDSRIPDPDSRLTVGDLLAELTQLLGARPPRSTTSRASGR